MCLFVVILAVMGGYVQAESDGAVGTVVYVSGEANVQRNGEIPIPLEFGDDIYPQDILETGDGTLRVLFDDDTVLSLVSHTKVMVTEFIYRPDSGIRRTIFDLISGGIHAIVEKVGGLVSSDVRFQTPTAVVGIRGTTLGLYHHPQQGTTHILAFDDDLDTYHRDYPEQKLILNEGYITKVVDGPPHEPMPIPDDWHEFFKMDEISIQDVMRQPGATGLDSIAAAKLSGPAGGGGLPAIGDASAIQPPGFTGLPGALQEFPITGTAGTGGGPGGGGTDGGAGGGETGGGTGGVPPPGGGPVIVQPTFPDPDG